MRLVFLGTPEFAVPSLRAIREAGHEVALVVTQPDRPSRRGQAVMAAPAVKLAAEGMDLLQPENVNLSEHVDRIRAARPEALVVVAFGQRMGKELLSLAPRGCVNGHASLLPKFRGASPIASAILKGHAQTGVTIMRIAERMDAGPILLQRAIPIGAEDTTDSLGEKLAGLSAGMLVELLAAWTAGREVAETQQDEARASYAKKLKKEDGLIPWERPVKRVDCHIRAMFSWPVAFTYLHAEGKPPQRVAIRRARPCEYLTFEEVLDELTLPEEELKRMVSEGELERFRSGELKVPGPTPPKPSSPGTVLGVFKEGLRVATGEGEIDLLELQPENRKAMDARSFVNGWRVKPGDRFGPP